MFVEHVTLLTFTESFLNGLIAERAGQPQIFPIFSLRHSLESTWTDRTAVALTNEFTKFVSSVIHFFYSFIWEKNIKFLITSLNCLCKSPGISLDETVAKNRASLFTILAV